MSRELLQQAFNYVSAYIGDGDEKADMLHAALQAELAKPPIEPVGMFQFHPEDKLWKAHWEHIYGATEGIPLYAGEPPSTTGVGTVIDSIVRQVAELPDRNSPEDWPEAMLVTQDELAVILAVILEATIGRRHGAIACEPTEDMTIAGFECDAMDALSSACVEKGGWPYSCKQSAELVNAVYKAMTEADKGKV